MVHVFGKLNLKNDLVGIIIKDPWTIMGGMEMGGRWGGQGGLVWGGGKRQRTELEQ